MSAITGNERTWARQTARVLTPAVAWLLAVQAAHLAVGYLGADGLARVPAALAALAGVTHRVALAGGLVWLFARGGRVVEAWLLASALADPDPVLFYEHIALYREPRIKQMLEEKAPAPFTVAPVTVAPIVFATGAGSPVTIDSST